MRRVLLMLTVATSPLAARAQTVTITAAAARDGGVNTAHPPLIHYTPLHYAYGIVESPAALLSFRASIIEAAAGLQLANANWRRTSQLYHAAHNVSVASLEQAQAAKAVAAAKLAALKANASATYGSSLGKILLAPDGPMAALASGDASLIEVNVSAPVLRKAPLQAAARIEGATPIPLTLIGAAGQVPMGMLGQGFYYESPALPSGTPLSVSLPEGSARTGYAIPLSALVYHNRKASMFVETRPGQFAMVKVPMDMKLHHRGGMHGYFVPERLIPRGGAIVTQGAGLLLSIVAHDKAAKQKPGPKTAADPDQD
jgi:hypothetical protein